MNQTTEAKDKTEKPRFRMTIIPDTRPKNSYTEWTKEHWPINYWNENVRAVSRRDGTGKIHAFGYQTRHYQQL